MSWQNRIAVDPQVQHGKPVVRGTRVPVARIVGGLASGMTSSQVADAYGVTLDDVRACLDFAGHLIEQEEHHPLPS